MAPSWNICVSSFGFGNFFQWPHASSDTYTYTCWPQALCHVFRLQLFEVSRRSQKFICVLFFHFFFPATILPKAWAIELSIFQSHSSHWQKKKTNKKFNWNSFLPSTCKFFDFFVILQLLLSHVLLLKVSSSPSHWCNERRRLWFCCQMVQTWWCKFGKF